jgi:hypothetical protein
MKRRALASLVGVGVVGIAPWAHAQTAAPAAPELAPGPEAPAVTEPRPSAPAAPAPAAPAPAPAPAPNSAAPQDAASSAETLPEDDAKPSSGVGLIVGGWIVTGVGVVNLATIPVCSADFYPRESEDLCVTLSIAFGVAGVVIGVPLLVVGYNKRSKYKEWSKRHAVLDHLLRTQVAVQNDSALLLYRGSF